MFKVDGAVLIISGLCGRYDLEVNIFVCKTSFLGLFICVRSMFLRTLYPLCDGVLNCFLVLCVCGASLILFLRCASV